AWLCSTRRSTTESYTRLPTRRSSDLLAGRSRGALDASGGRLDGLPDPRLVGELGVGRLGTVLGDGKAVGAHDSPIVRETPLGYLDRKSTRLNSSHVKISYAVCCLQKK